MGHIFYQNKFVFIISQTPPAWACLKMQIWIQADIRWLEANHVDAYCQAGYSSTAKKGYPFGLQKVMEPVIVVSPLKDD